MSNFKKAVKHLLKKNNFGANFLSSLIYYYLKIVYFTSRWRFIELDLRNTGAIADSEATIFALWHNRLAFGPGIFKKNYKTAALVSPHSDGKIISKIIKNFKFAIIEGSTNRNPTEAVKHIIRSLSQKYNIVVTPDGPRGPIYKVNSNIATIARKYDSKLIPISCACTRYISLKRSWDKLIIPMPFTTIYVIIGTQILLTDDYELNDQLLESALIEITSRADNMVKHK